MVDGPNLYIYCNNDPINWIEPWGLCSGGQQPKATGWWPKFLDYLVPGYRNYGGPSRSGPGAPADFMDQAFQRHDAGYRSGNFNGADFSLLYDISSLSNNPQNWGQGVNSFYAQLYRIGAYTVFFARQWILETIRSIEDFLTPK